MAVVRTLGSFAIGAAAMYFLDPRAGRRRRAVMRDRFAHAAAAERDLLGKARRDLEHRARGAVARLKHPATRSATRPSPTRRARLLPAARVVVGATGLALALASSKLARLGGLALLARAVVNRPLTEAVGLRQAWIEVTKTITIDAPIERVFALWSRLDGFPRFMDHVRSVQAADGDPQTSHWIVDGPLGGPIAFASRTTRFEQDRLIAWQTVPGSQVKHTGEIHFERTAAGGTRVQLHLRYCPPGGLLGHAIAKLIGADPKTRLDQDLVRAKGLLERGRTRAHHQLVALDEVIPRFS